MLFDFSIVLAANSACQPVRGFVNRKSPENCEFDLTVLKKTYMTVTCESHGVTPV